MRGFLDGKEGDLISFAKDSDNLFYGKMMADDGGVHDLSTATLDLVVYSRPNRNVTATATHAATVTTAANGEFTVAIADTAATYGPGRYYGFLRRTLSADITWANKYVIIDVK
jgi:hypothetical protein